MRGDGSGSRVVPRTEFELFAERELGSGSFQIVAIRPIRVAMDAAVAGCVEVSAVATRELQAEHPGLLAKLRVDPVLHGVLTLRGRPFRTRRASVSAWGVCGNKRKLSRLTS